MVNRPAMIRTDESNAFAHDTIFRRLPANIREVGQLNPDYPASIQMALEKLAKEIESDAPVGAFNPFSPDVDLWESLAYWSLSPEQVSWSWLGR